MVPYVVFHFWNRSFFLFCPILRVFTQVLKENLLDQSVYAFHFRKKNHEHYLAFKVAIVLYFRSDHFEHDSKITQKSAAIISLRICRKRKENIILDKKNKIRSCTLYLISQSFQKCFLFSSKYLLSPS